MMPPREELQEEHSWQRKQQVDRSRGRKGGMYLILKDRPMWLYVENYGKFLYNEVGRKIWIMWDVKRTKKQG